MLQPAHVLLGFTLVTGAITAQSVDFTRQVRPLLADRCFACHGPDAAQRKAGLRLDSRESATATLPSGHVAIAPGLPAESELVRRITATGVGRMPKPESKLTLSDEEVALLVRWVTEGAAYAPHWSLQLLPDEIASPPLSDGMRNPIDAFVHARLEGRELVPAPEASRETLIRRVSFTLAGLPPTPGEVDAFLADDSPGAFEKVVEGLLDSPRYGERMAGDWLDAARYADTFGYQNDVERPVWPWRDWVVAAFNDNLPYDDFVTWQLAGDLLPEPSRDQILATAFNRLHRQTNEGGSVEEEFRAEYVADRTQTFSTAFLGLTLGCARCHDHKFDPIEQREFYALSAFFANVDESGLYSHFTRSTPTPALALPAPEQEAALEEAEQQVVLAERQLSVLRRGRREAYQTWLAAAPAQLPVPGLVGHFPFDRLDDGGALANRADSKCGGRTHDRPALIEGVTGKALLLSGENNASFPKVADFDRDTPFSLSLWIRVPEAFDRAVILHRSRAWTDAGSRGYELLLEDGRLSFALVHFWPGNAARVRCVDAVPLERWTHVVLTYDGSSRAGGMALYVDGDRAKATVIRDGLTREITGGGANALTLGQRFRDRGFKGGAVDELRVYRRRLTAVEAAQLFDGRALSATWARSAEDDGARRELYDYYLHTIDPLVRRQLAALRRARRTRSEIQNGLTEIMVMRETAPRPTFVLRRGAYDQRGDQVAPDTPACLPPFPTEGERNRLGLARWLTDPRHPLAARVAVNRIWQMHFGRGLVNTTEDFGSQGARPTHPRLLDWLARRFVTTGWDVKALHRLIVTSATFRQSSTVPPAVRALDPENRLLARGARVRLSAEMIRDQALWASGLLVEKLGGPPVKPYQPAGLWREKSGAVYRADAGEGLYRRSLYTFWKRTSPPPAMMTFDAAKRDVCVVRRQATATPLQALVLLNDPQHVEAARVLAASLMRGHTDLDERLRSGFRRAVGRSPRPAEMRILADAHAEQLALYRARPDDAAALLATGEHPSAEGLPMAEHAALTMVASLVLNLDEAVILQ